MRKKYSFAQMVALVLFSAFCASTALSQSVEFPRSHAYTCHPGDTYCNLGVYKAEIYLDVYEESDGMSKIKFTVPKGDTLEAISGVFATLKPGKLRINKSVDWIEEFGFYKGARVLMVDELTEGWYTLLQGDELVSVEPFWIDAEIYDQLGEEEKEDWAGVVEEIPTQELWLEVMWRGEVGWVRIERDLPNFYGYSFDVSIASYMTHVW